MIITSSKSKNVAQERKFNNSIACDPAINNSSTMITMQNLNVDLPKIDNITGASLIAQLVKNLPAMQETLVRFLGQEDPLEKGKATHSSIPGLPLVAQRVKNPPAMRETWVGKIPWRRACQPTPVFLPGGSPWTEEPGGLQSTGSQRLRHDSATNTQHSLKHIDVSNRFLT